MNGNLNPFHPAEPITGTLAEFKITFQGLNISGEDIAHYYNQMKALEYLMNDEYQVAIDKNPQHGFVGYRILHLSIKRLDKDIIHDWRDLQQIKNMIVGPEYEAMELYPAESRLVDTANQYHLWVFISRGTDLHPQIPIGWTTRLIMSADIAGTRQRKFNANENEKR